MAQYEKKAFHAEEKGQAEPSLVELTPLPHHLAPTPPQTSQEGVMSWLHDSGADDSHPPSHVTQQNHNGAASGGAMASTPQGQPAAQPQPQPQPQGHPSPKLGPASSSQSGCRFCLTCLWLHAVLYKAEVT